MKFYKYEVHFIVCVFKYENNLFIYIFDFMIYIFWKTSYPPFSCLFDNKQMRYYYSGKKYKFLDSARSLQVMILPKVKG